MKLKWRPKSGLEQSGVKIVRFLLKEGYQAFFVGGFARDLRLRKKSDNLDIATSARPDEIEKILKRAKFYFKGPGKKFGTILVVTKHGPIEITTFRGEGRYTDNRHPDRVEFIADYVQDAKRRDFGINALYFDPLSGEIFDPVGGLKDFQRKLIKFVGDPKKRIDEDGLRMLRAVRFATQLGYKLEKNSFAAIKTRSKYIQDIAGERIKQELDKILLSKNRADGLRLLDEIGLLRFLIPEIDEIKRFSHKSKMYHLEGSIFDHTLLALSKIKETDLNLIYAILFHDIGKPQKAQRVLKKEGWVISTKGHADVGADIFLKFAQKLRFSRESRQIVEWLIRNHMLMFDFSKMNPQKQIELAQHEVFPLLLRHWHYDESATKRQSYMDDHHKRYLKSVQVGRKLLITLAQKQSLIKRLARGEQIMKYGGLKPGKQLGQIIKEVEAQIVLGKIKSILNLKEFLS